MDIKQLIMLMFSIMVISIDSYDSVIHQLLTLNHSIIGIEQGYKHKVQYLPAYDTAGENYDKPPLKDPRAEKYMLDTIIPQLQHLESLNNVDAIVTLGDIYVFGNYSMATDYHKALHYYEKAISIKSNGHAYFMLGFMYSTGMFGEIEINQPKAQLYYQLGMEQGDVNALLVSAYRLSEGIGVPQNCELALVYYTRLAQWGLKYLLENDDEVEPTDISYNVKLPDFIGGIYGDDVSESIKSIATPKQSYLETFEQDFTLDTFDSKMVYYYFHALDEYDGYYNTPKNYFKAKQSLQTCVDYGKKLPTYHKVKAMSINDKFRLSKCLLLLGHMYLKGQGTEKDYEKAHGYLTDLLRFFNNSEALSDLGYIFEHGLIDQPNLNKAMEYYKLAHDENSDTGSRRLSQILVNTSPFGDIMASEKRGDIVTAMKNAVTRGDTEALYHFGNFIQMGVTQGVTNQYTCNTNILYYKAFLERLNSFFYPHLKYAFDELNSYNYKNALVGYLIAAEQGVEKAQVSAGWLLYQLDPFPLKGTKNYNYQRVKSAMEYFERASDQGDIDSTIFLGDINFYGVESASVPVDYTQAFNLYSKAAHLGSPHGCFSLAYMYEHGLGVVNNTIDYFMAKRYYDLSLKYRIAQGKENNIPLYFALLKLRIKYLIWGHKISLDETSWFSNFKNLGSINEEDTTRARIQHGDTVNDGANNDANNHDNDTFFDNELELGDYFVIVITVFVFGVFMIRGLHRQLQRLRGQIPNEAENNNINGDNNDNNEGWRVDNNGVNLDFRRGNFEFHFFAI